jgi:hypothetical protein
MKLLSGEFHPGETISVDSGVEGLKFELKK